MQEQKLAVKWMRLQESLLSTAVGSLPTVALGVVLRRMLYPIIMGRMGKAIFIQDGVQFVGANHIEIGDEAYLFRGVRINAQNQNCKVLIGNQVVLERDVDIGTGAGEDCLIEIGDRTFIGQYTCIGGPGHVKIGKHCLIAAHCGIVANNHVFVDPVEKIRDQGITKKGIEIGDDCWLGYGVKVLDGVNIGEGSVIGAGAVVTRDIPSYSVAVGVPARVISSRQPEKQSRLVHQQSPYNTRDNRYAPLDDVLGEVEQSAQTSHQNNFSSTSHKFPPVLIENLLQALLECMRQAMQVDTVTVLLRAEDGQQLAVRATLGLEEEIATQVRIPIGEGFAGHIAAQKEQMIVEDLAQVEVVSPVLRQKGLHSMLGVPMLAEDKLIGVFHVGTYRPRQFTHSEAQTLQYIADRISLAIEPILRLWQSPRMADG